MTTLTPPWGTVVLVIEVCLFVYFVIYNLAYAFTSVVAVARLPGFVRLRRVDPVVASYSVLDPPISVIVPAYDEEAFIIPAVRSLLAFEYSEFEVIVVNDGSNDRTLELLAEAFELEPYPGVPRVIFSTREVRGVFRSLVDPSLVVVDKVNGGKADALNAGINTSRYPLVFAADADSRYDRAALRLMVEPMLQDPRTVAVGSAIGVADDGADEEPGMHNARRLHSGLLQRFQVLDYLRSFLATRMGWAPFNALAIVSGASGLWRKEVLAEAGGYRTDTIWEDMEMTLRVHNLLRSKKADYRLAFTPYPVCWTHVPDTIRALYHQRKGWSRHLSECVTIHRRLTLTGGALGWASVPFLVLFEWLAPVVVAFGFAFTVVGFAVGFLNGYAQLVLLTLVLIVTMQMSLVSVLLDQVSYNAYGGGLHWPLVSALVLENIGYRQIVWYSSLAGMLSWVFRRPLRADGPRPPGLFVRAWRPGDPRPGSEHPEVPGDTPAAVTTSARRRGRPHLT